jgi:3-oxoacyl-[acyl-carrier protein] reductase
MENRVCVITGAGQGIGRVFAKHFAAAGTKVVIAERGVEKGRAVEREISDAGGTALFIDTDVTSTPAVEAMVASVLDRFGQIDILINNARWSELTLAPIEEITDEDWAMAMDINVNGAFRCARAVVPAMKQRQWGRIINMSSATVLLPPPRPYLHYVTTKAALIGLTRSLARELGPDGITVNAILPGSVETEIERSSQPPREQRDVRAMATQSIQRREVPEDMAGAAYFLASDAASFITGQSLPIDGGMSFS